MRNSIWWVIIIILLLVIAGLSWFLFMAPAPAGGTATTTATTTGSTTGTNGGTTTGTTGTLKDRVVIDAPRSGGTVFKNFTVTGKAPGPWYFEASFPIEVRSASGTVVATGHGQALTDWMTTADVAFKADIVVQNYTGPATLVLMNDNPSGDPARQMSVSIPIVIQ